VVVGVSLDGILRSPSGPLFHYHGDIEIDVVSPTSGIYSGGTQVRDRPSASQHLLAYVRDTVSFLVPETACSFEVGFCSAQIVIEIDDDPLSNILDFDTVVIEPSCSFSGLGSVRESVCTSTRIGGRREGSRPMATELVTQRSLKKGTPKLLSVWAVKIVGLRKSLRTIRAQCTAG
jgi:hypothetical protein